MHILSLTFICFLYELTKILMDVNIHARSHFCIYDKQIQEKDQLYK
jgi:hypothetical protein